MAILFHSPGNSLDSVRIRFELLDRNGGIVYSFKSDNIVIPETPEVNFTLPPLKLLLSKKLVISIFDADITANAPYEFYWNGELVASFQADTLENNWQIQTIEIPQSIKSKIIIPLLLGASLGLSVIALKKRH